MVAMKEGKKERKGEKEKGESKSVSAEEDSDTPGERAWQKRRQ